MNTDTTTIRGSLLQIDDEPEAPKPTVVTIAPKEGERHLVGGVAGWEGGDRISRTSDGHYEVNDAGPKAGSGPGITGDAHEGASAKARREFGINGPWELTPVHVPDLSGALIQVAKQYLIRHRPSGRITSKHSVTDKYVLGRPEDMDILDLLSREITRGGSFKGESITFLSSEAVTWTMPDGQEVIEFISAFKDWTGTGSDLIVRHKSAAECRNIIKAILSGSQSCWRFPHNSVGQANLRLFAEILNEIEEENDKARVLMGGWGRTKVNRDMLVKLATDCLPKKKDKAGKATDVLTSDATSRLDRIMDHLVKAPGCNRGGDFTLWDCTQAVSYETTRWNLFSKGEEWSDATGLEGVMYGAAGRFLDQFTNAVNGTFVEIQKGSTDTAIRQAVKVVLS